MRNEDLKALADAMRALQRQTAQLTGMPPEDPTALRADDSETDVVLTVARRVSDQVREQLQAFGHTVEREQRGAAADIAHLEREISERDAALRSYDPRRRGLKATARDFALALLYRVYDCLPANHLRDLAKAVFYAVLGLLRPQSSRVLAYREARRRALRVSLTRRAGMVANSDGLGTSASGKSAVLVFPIIDWHYRHQRPQHLALQLARAGHPVFYFSTQFSQVGGRPVEPDWVADNVAVVPLPCVSPHPVIYHDAPTARQVRSLANSVQALREAHALGSVTCVVQHPFWAPVVEALTNCRVVYDCMDHHSGFDNTGREIAALEDRLIKTADLVIVTSTALESHVSSLTDRVIVIRNATEYDHFATPAEKLAIRSTRPIIGYYGAIAEWFDVEMFRHAAERMPDCDFALVGAVHNADVVALRTLPNVRFYGEVPYADLPAYLHSFAVCTIPFKVIPLTLATNPVKVYEYLSAGKPVVATGLPEVRLLDDYVRVAETPDEFLHQLRAALADDAPDEVARRQAFARENTWAARGEAYARLVATMYPKVSVIVLTYNQLPFTKACLASLEQFTRYPDWELVIVDNASADGTPDYLREFAASRSHVRLILNDENLGFAAGNNIGARAAVGEVLVFLNNDTFVTDGWLGDLLTHFRRDQRLGLLNPVTNNIGNEARIDIQYSNMQEMAKAARTFTSQHRGQRTPLRAAAFFCVMVPRSVWVKVGDLDESFGVGFFEDDDYAMRARAAGYTAACADDVFVHHHLSASFDALAQEKKLQLFETNKKIFEAKWGPWRPHEYRREAHP